MVWTEDEESKEGSRKQFFFNLSSCCSDLCLCRWCLFNRVFSECPDSDPLHRGPPSTGAARRLGFWFYFSFLLSSGPVTSFAPLPSFSLLLFQIFWLCKEGDCSFLWHLRSIKTIRALTRDHTWSSNNVIKLSRSVHCKEFLPEELGLTLLQSFVYELGKVVCVQSVY